MHKKYDATVVGSGPNGLAAAITLAEQGYKVHVVEGASTYGGGMRSSDLGMQGCIHDVCSAIHPMAFGSPFFKRINLEKYGLKWAQPTLACAHPLDGNKGAYLHQSISETQKTLGADARKWASIFGVISSNIDKITPTILGRIGIPKDILALADFGVQALLPAQYFWNTRFKTKEAQALFAGLAAHSILPLNKLSTSAIGLVLGSIAHQYNWPIPIGGSQSIANAMLAYFKSLGGTLENNYWVENLDKIRDQSKTVLLDIGPKKLVEIAKNELPNSFKNRIDKFKYGNGVYKIDFLLSEPVPWLYEPARHAGTVHLGGEAESIALSEEKIFNGEFVDDMYLLVAQQSLFDATRAPNGKHTLWVYAHTPANFEQDISKNIINQIERFAPGFSELVLDQKIKTAVEYEQYNPNYVGGDINGGQQDITQIFTRPIAQFDPYKTPLDGVFMCSSSTPPGGGVHGMCGYNAAISAQKYLKRRK